MLLTELSERSGVSVASIKYYRREGLLHAGERLTATRQDYDETHVERLALITALRQIVDAPVADVAALCAAVDDPDQPLVAALEIAQAIALGLPAVRHPGTVPSDEHPLVRTLVEAMGWPDVATYPRALLDQHLRTMESWGMTVDPGALTAQARAADALATLDLSAIRTSRAGEPGASRDVMVTRAFRGMVTQHMLTTTLRSLAQASVSIGEERRG